jgi:hypothetical protein
MSSKENEFLELKFALTREFAKLSNGMGIFWICLKEVLDLMGNEIF